MFYISDLTEMSTNLATTLKSVEAKQNSAISAFETYKLKRYDRQLMINSMPTIMLCPHPYFRAVQKTSWSSTFETVKITEL